MLSLKMQSYDELEDFDIDSLIIEKVNRELMIYHRAHRD